MTGSNLFWNKKREQQSVS